MIQESQIEQLSTFANPLPPGKKMSYEEFLDWLDEDTYAEWVNGVVVFMSPISIEHQNVTGFLLSLIRIFVETHQLGVVFYEPFQMKTGPDLPGRSPDIIFVDNDNFSRLKNAHLEGPADLVVEVVSPESRIRDRGEKFYEYEQGGVCEYWLIDPLRKQAEFYQRGEDGIYRVMPINNDGIFRSAVLEGLWLKVDWLWQEPLPLLLNVLKEWGLV
ncbi:TPA: Uma2 family endonuclease [Candidatus Poribacteria bacterium]|nr:Uma2 family endonuclease [Candidatus Poribacteria bacterium]